MRSLAVIFRQPANGDLPSFIQGSEQIKIQYFGPVGTGKPFDNVFQGPTFSVTYRLSNVQAPMDSTGHQIFYPRLSGHYAYRLQGGSDC